MAGGQRLHSTNRCAGKTMADPSILIRREGSVVHLRFNRPEALNAINLDMAELFERHLLKLADDATARVVVLSGEGRAFMAGGDLSVFRDAPNLPDAADVLIGPMHRAVQVLRDLPMIVIASVHGAVAGAGFSLAMLADLAIAADSATFNMAYARIHAVPDCGGSWALARLVGARKALEFALLSESIGADEAARLGLVNRVVPAADLAAATEVLATRITAQSPASALGIRDLLRRAPGASLADQLESERLAFRAAAAEPEFAQSIAAFFARKAKA
jgi:2-(1,2-epoxy-1,2-dihydrophenyl)acetyl-CoA isomerase